MKMADLGVPGGVLGASWGLLGASWGVLGASWGVLRASESREGADDVRGAWRRLVAARASKAQVTALCPLVSRLGPAGVAWGRVGGGRRAVIAVAGREG